VAKLQIIFDSTRKSNAVSEKTVSLYPKDKKDESFIQTRERINDPILA
jgi:hypothetical protein